MPFVRERFKQLITEFISIRESAGACCDLESGSRICPGIDEDRWSRPAISRYLKPYINPDVLRQTLSVLSRPTSPYQLTGHQLQYINSHTSDTTSYFLGDYALDMMEWEATPQQGSTKPHPQCSLSDKAHFILPSAYRELPHKIESAMVGKTVIQQLDTALSCSTCHKSFTETSKLKYVITLVLPWHLRTVILILTCMMHLSRHEKSHLKIHRCSYRLCNFNGSTRGDLQRHLNQHTKEKTYDCTRCNKSFLRRDNLVRHMRGARRCDRRI